LCALVATLTIDPMAITTADKERARYHLGYMTVTVASSFAFGIPQSTETQWMFESAITRVMPESEPRITKLLDMLDEIEAKMFCASSELFAKRAGDLEPNLDQPDALEKEYVRWANRLADMLGVMPYPYSDRFAQAKASGYGNVPVRRG
jgi:hypothetical protein